MRDWALPLLRCLACEEALPEEGGILDRIGDGLRCRSCGARYPIRDDVADFLRELHPVPERERRAVRSEDRWAWGREAPGDADEDRDPDAAELSYRRAVEETREILEELLERVPLQENPLVVEIGADFCWTSALLLEHGARVIATDISDHLLHAPDGSAEDLCRIQADMNRLPVADGTADVVWATACVHHSWDLQTTFREIERVLRPGGRAYLCNEPVPSWPRYLLGFGFGRRERERGINETWILRRSWLGRCRESGLRPRLVFPRMSARRLARRLARRGLPAVLGRLVAPFHRWLQVSIHLIAEKPGTR